jgi:hypothetical protein
MSDQPPRRPPPAEWEQRPASKFDPMRAGFYLVVTVIAVQLFIVLGGVGMCIVFADQIVAGTFRCDRDNRLAELLASALSTAAAYVAGLATKR